MLNIQNKEMIIRITKTTSWGGEALEVVGVFISEVAEVAPGVWCSGSWLFVVSCSNPFFTRSTATIFLILKKKNKLDY